MKTITIEEFRQLISECYQNIKEICKKYEVEPEKLQQIFYKYFNDFKEIALKEGNLKAFEFIINKINENDDNL